MNPVNKQFLDDNRHHHTCLVKAFYLRHLDGRTRSEMVRVMQEEFHPGYHTDLWCGPCVSDMVIKLYRHYDEWLAANAEKIEDEIDVKEAEERKEEKDIPFAEVKEKLFVKSKNHKRR